MKLPLGIALLGVMVTMSVTKTFAEDIYQEKRQQMLAVVQQMVVMTKSYTGKAALGARPTPASSSVSVGSPTVGAARLRPTPTAASSLGGRSPARSIWAVGR